VKAAAKKSGVNCNASLRWFHHAFATDGLKNNAPLPLIRRDLGHASPETGHQGLCKPDDNVVDVRSFFKLIALV